MTGRQARTTLWRIVAAAGACYFLVTFGIAFLIGIVRTLAIAPYFGDLAAVAIELPIMVAVSWLTCRLCLRWFDVPDRATARLAMGGLAFLLLMAAEWAFAVLVFSRSSSTYFAEFGSANGAIGLVAQMAFALMPVVSQMRHRAEFGRTFSGSVRLGDALRIAKRPGRPDDRH